MRPLRACSICSWTSDSAATSRNSTRHHPAPLPRELHEAIDSPLAAVRVGAVQELTRLLHGRHAGLALARLPIQEESGVELPHAMRV